MVFRLVKARMPSDPNSRPKPESLIPPKGKPGALSGQRLIPTIPHYNPSLANRSARDKSPVKTEAPMP